MGYKSKHKDDMLKKPNGVIQTANLYTDKSDVGNNYLTLKDNNNIIYSVLDVNGDIDCKINKNNISYKIKKESSNVPTTKQSFTTPFTYIPPPNVKVIRFSTNEKSFYVKAESPITFNCVNVVANSRAGWVTFTHKEKIVLIISTQNKSISVVLYDFGEIRNGKNRHQENNPISCFIETSNDINNYQGQIYTFS